MTQREGQGRREKPGHEDSQIVGFRMPIPLAQAIKIEAVRRQVPLNKLIVEMWDLYREAKGAR